MAYDVGDAVDVTTTVTVAGVATNATMAILVTAPDGTTQTPAITNTSTGNYKATVVPTQVGTYLYRWTASGAATAVEEKQFEVRAAGVRLVSLQDAKLHLNITGTTDDDEIQDKIDSVTAMVEDIVGPVIPQTVIEAVDSHGYRFRLTSTPVLSITSVLPTTTNLTAPAAADLTIEGRSGAVYYTAGGRLPPGRMLVTYTAGRRPIPSAIRTAAKVILAHLWETQHNSGGGRPQPGMEEVVVIGSGHAIPNRAAEMLAFHAQQKAPVVA